MKSDMEDKEWLDDSMSLKQVDPNNPFTVPAGYFNELEQRITSYVHLDDLKASENFTVPENYFNELSANIQSRIAIEDAVNSRGDGFAVPENYFDTLEDHLKARILIEEELQEADDHFTVPADYFEQLNKNIINKTVKQDIVRRKGVVRKLFATGAFKYAAAACFALIIGTGIFVIQIDNPVSDHNNSFLHQQVSKLPVSDIQSYLQQDVDANDTQHAVIDEGAPVNADKLTNTLQDNNDTNQ